MSINIIIIESKTMISVFDQVGFIINEYVPELYRSDVFKNTHILTIVDDEIKLSIEGFEKYVNLKNLDMENFNGSLEPLEGIGIQQLWMNSFNDNVSPLKLNTRLKLLWTPLFSGDLLPLSNLPIKLICSSCYVDNLYPIQKIYRPFVNIFSRNSEYVTDIYDKNRQDVEILSYRYGEIKLIMSCMNLSEDHNKIMITFHNIDDHNFEENLEVDDTTLEIQSSAYIVTANFNNTHCCGEIEFFKLKNSNNCYVCSLNIDNIDAGYGFKIPIIKARYNFYLAFRRENTVIKIVTSNLSYVDKIVVRIRVE